MIWVSKTLCWPLVQAISSPSKYSKCPSSPTILSQSSSQCCLEACSGHCSWPLSQHSCSCCWCSRPAMLGLLFHGTDESSSRLVSRTIQTRSSGVLIACWCTSLTGHWTLTRWCNQGPRTVRWWSTKTLVMCHIVLVWLALNVFCSV